MADEQGPVVPDLSVCIRVLRGLPGRWQSSLIKDLSYVTDEEVASLPWADTLRDMLKDACWYHDEPTGCWINPDELPVHLRK